MGLEAAIHGLLVCGFVGLMELGHGRDEEVPSVRGRGRREGEGGGQVRRLEQGKPRRRLTSHVK